MLETKIEALTQAVIALTELIGKIEAGKSEPVIKKQEKIEAGLKTLRTESAATPAPVVEAAPVMPAAPTFEPVVEAAPAGGAPFTDGKGLIDYVMSAYKEMGPEKGSKIQGVLTEMGLQNVNELRPTEYDTFFAKVEALK